MAAVRDQLVCRMAFAFHTDAFLANFFAHQTSTPPPSEGELNDKNKEQGI